MIDIHFDGYFFTLDKKDWEYSIILTIEEAMQVCGELNNILGNIYRTEE